MLLGGAVGLVDLFLPGSHIEGMPAWVQPATAAVLLAVGGGLFHLGGRWR
jgi:hypothetical protein